MDSKLDKTALSIVQKEKIALQLTKREFFAAMALQETIASDGAYVTDEILGKYKLDSPQRIARRAVEYADALIAELNKNTEKN